MPRKIRGSVVRTIVLVLIIILLIGFPLLWMVISSFKPGTELFSVPPKIFTAHPSLEWYIEAFQNENVIHYCVNSLYIATVVMLIDMVIGTLTSYSLARFNYPGRKVIQTCVLAAYCIPPIMLMFPLYNIMNTLKLSGSHAGVIIGHLTVTLPFSVWLMITYFRKLPKELDEAAMIDGASAWQILVKVDFPICIPGILSTGIMAFIMSWNEFLLSSVLTNKESMKTLTVGLANYISSTHIDWGIIMALGTVTTIPVIVLFALVQKYFVDGMTAGAVKG